LQDILFRNACSFYLSLGILSLILCLCINILFFPYQKFNYCCIVIHPSLSFYVFKSTLYYTLIPIFQSLCISVYFNTYTLFHQHLPKVCCYFPHAIPTLLKILAIISCKRSLDKLSQFDAGVTTDSVTLIK
jgi:hypothetical protein